MRLNRHTRSELVNQISFDSLAAVRTAVAHLFLQNIVAQLFDFNSIVLRQPFTTLLTFTFMRTIAPTLLLVALSAISVSSLIVGGGGSHLTAAQRMALKTTAEQMCQSGKGLTACGKSM